MIPIILVLAGILVCILLSAYFSGSEMALSACNQIRLENEAEDGDSKAKRALRLAENFDDTLSTILMGNNLVNIAASSLTTVGVLLLTGSDKLNGVGTLIITVLVILFGETVPKIFCKANATGMSKAVSGGISFLRILFYPTTYVIVKLVQLLTKGIKEEKTNPEDEVSDELQTIIETAEDEGVLDAERSELVSAAIDFKDTTAEEAMTARVDMDVLDISATREEIMQTVAKSNHSRLPVYEDSIDHIVGVVHVNHLLKEMSLGQDFDIRAIMLEPCFIYKTTKLPAVLNALKKARQHLAIVVDEYSGTLGVITMEDVIEEIVGDIWDETDIVEEEVVPIRDGLLEVDGDMVIDDFLELIEVDPDSFDYESLTVGGWVTEYKGDFPEVGYSFVFGNSRIFVTEMDERRVEKIRVIHPYPPKPAEPQK
jgi:CBS domain containing-hemolysin-like protein